MKRLGLVFLAAACAPMDATIVERRALDATLIAAYGFDDGAGSVLHDATANHLDGSLSSGPTWTASGKFGGALTFGAGYVTVPDNSKLDLTSGMTLEAWVYPTNTSGSWQLVAAKERPGALAYGIYAFNSAAPLARVATSSTNYDVSAGTKPPQNQWTHLAETYDGVTLRLYRNGVQVATRSVNKSITSTANPFRIGGHGAFGTPADLFAGRIDELRIYSRPLSAAEIGTDMVTPIGGGGGAGGAGGQDGGADVGSDSSGAAGASGGGAGGVAAGGTLGSAVYPLKLAAGQRYLVDQQDRPFLIVGDAAWSLAVSISTADADVYLADRQARGFNSIIVNLIEHKFTTQAPPRNAAGDLPFAGTLAGGAPDFTTPSEAYFAHVDAVLGAANARGIQVLLVPAYLGYQGGDEGWWSEIVANGVSRMATYGAFVGARYRNYPNVLWVAGADYNPPSTAYTDAVESAIRAADPNHLHTGHQESGTSALDEWGFSSWLKVNDIYGYPALGQNVYDLAEAQYARADWQPLFLIESTYEHNTWTASPPVLIRHQAYEALLSGCAGEVSGNVYVWPFGGPDISGAVHPWLPNLASQGAADMSRLASLFLARHWETLAPDFDHVFVTAGYTPGADRATSSFSTDGKLGIAYLPTVRAITVAMAKMSGPTTARWFDPTTGGFATVVGSPFANSGSRSFSPAGANAGGDGDWILLLEAP